MRKTFSSCVLAMAVVVMVHEAKAFDLAKEKKIVFGDGQWEFLGEEQEEQEVHECSIVWGKTKLYRLKKNPQIIGMATYAFTDPEPFYKQAGNGKQSLTFIRAGVKWIRGAFIGAQIFGNSVTSVPIKIVASFRTRKGIGEFTIYNEERDYQPVEFRPRLRWDEESEDTQ